MRRMEVLFNALLEDEGRLLIYALREEYINCFMVLSCKSGMVLSDEEKASLKVSGECTISNLLLINTFYFVF